MKGKQLSFLQALLEAPNMTMACKKAGISRKTGYRYLSNREFKADLERRTIARDTEKPIVVMIHYNSDIEQWQIQEQYINARNNRTFFLKSYSDYVIQPGSRAQILLDLINEDNPEESNLYSFNAEDILKQIRRKGVGVSLEYISEDPKEPLRSVFNIVEHTINLSL